MKLFIFLLNLFLFQNASFAQGGCGSCSFNRGNCPVRSQATEAHGCVQDYGYGGLGSMASEGARNALNPLRPIAQLVTGAGPVNPECVWNPVTPVYTGAGRLYNGAGGSATTEELEAIQCAGEAGRGYSFGGGNVGQLIATAENLDELQEELVFLTAIDEIRQFNECQNGLFRSYFNAADPRARTEMLSNAWNQFNDIGSELKPRLQEELRRRSTQARADSIRHCIKEVCPQPTARDIAAITNTGENNAKIEQLRREINVLISRIPMGNRDSMRVAMESLLLSEDSISEDRFRQVYDSEMQKLDEAVQQSRNFIASITVDSSSDKRLYCVDRDLKENIYRSGQLDHTIEQMGLKDALSGFTRRSQNRYGLAGTVITEIALIPTYFVGYGAARLALRAGASSVRAVSAGGRALSSATRVAMLGIEAADYGAALSGAMADCSSDEFFARVDGKSCSPENEIGQIYEESSLAQCLTSAILPFASPLIGTTVRVAQSRKLSELYQAGKPGEAIVVTSKKRKRAPREEQSGSSIIVGDGRPRSGAAAATPETQAARRVPASEQRARDPEEIISQIAGDSRNFDDREIVIDILMGGAKKDEYLARGDEAFSARYRELEAKISSDPNRERYARELQEFAESRIASGNARAQAELDELKNTSKVTDEEIDCNAMNAVYPGSFPGAGGKCSRVRFDEDVKGKYCACGGMSKDTFSFLVKCPGSARDFRTTLGFADGLALPSTSLPSMCSRVDIPRGKECYMGSTAATYAGMGGAVQLLCMDQRSARWGATQDAAIDAFRLQTGTPRISPSRWSPFSNFSELQSIVERASVQCPEICDPTIFTRLNNEYIAATEKIRREVTDPQDLRRLESELGAFNLYMKDLQHGRLPTPALSQAAGYSNAERISAAGRILRSRDLSPTQQDAILRAHEVGRAQGRGYFTFEQADINEKARILREAGFDSDQVRRLMRNGIVGGRADAVDS